jgi:hypothetical protein
MDSYYELITDHDYVSVNFVFCFTCVSKSEGEVVPVHSVKVYRRDEVQFHAFLTSKLDACEWPASRPGRFSPGYREEAVLVASFQLSPNTTQPTSVMELLIIEFCTY